MRLISLAALLLYASLSIADEERPNAPIVASGLQGDCYAKSVPRDLSGQEGTTTVYKVQRGDDKPVQTYDWYAQQIHLLCNVWGSGGHWTTVARLGPWPRGHRANEKDLAIAFYKNGKLLNSYSTLDIAGDPGNVGGSVSHYQVFRDVLGFQWNDSSELEFQATAFDGTVIRFDPEHGTVIDRSMAAP